MLMLVKGFASLHARHWSANKYFKCFVFLGMSVFFFLSTIHRHRCCKKKGNSSFIGQRSCFALRASNLIAKRTPHQSPTTTTAQHNTRKLVSQHQMGHRLCHTYGNINCLAWFSFISNLFLSYFSFALCVTTA